MAESTDALAEALHCYRCGDYETATNLALGLLQSSPQNAEALRRLGDWADVFERMAAELRGRVIASPRPVKEPLRILVEIPAGELIDKLTILEIKRAQTDDPRQRRNVETELTCLRSVYQEKVSPSAELEELMAALRTVNETLWEIEDSIRLCERAQDFGARFIELARSVYLHNDRRSGLKRQINDLLGSRLIEEKVLPDYSNRPEPLQHRS